MLEELSNVRFMINAVMSDVAPVISEMVFIPEKKYS